jgi:trimethylamine--corrinoid protein Co-methyltransferase
MIDSAYAQIGKHLKLPTHAYMALSDAKVNDAQSGIETALGAALAALSGINVISGPGMLDFESCQSLEKLAIDNEICGMAYRLVAGVVQREEPIALDKFEGFKPDFQFLTLPHTRQWYRKEHILPVLMDRDPYEAWVMAGRKTTLDKAHKDVQDRIRKYALPPLADGPRKELDKIMTGYARSQGIKSLPARDA